MNADEKNNFVFFMINLLLIFATVGIGIGHSIQKEKYEILKKEAIANGYAEYYQDNNMIKWRWKCDKTGDN